MFYDPQYKLFIGFPNKVKHVEILKAYYKNDSISGGTSWADLGNMVDKMFNEKHGSLKRSPVHFYGNDGVCLFKYFVRSDDPRRSRTSSDGKGDITDMKGDAIVWTMLGVNLLCFLVITISYLIINIKTWKSSRDSGQTENPVIVRQNRNMQRRVAIIIATDFACWVPFIIISALHNYGKIDATNWYVTFAMTVLPLNSLINPLLYDNTLREFFDQLARSTVNKGLGAVRSLGTLCATTTEQTNVTAVEMADNPGEGMSTNNMDSPIALTGNDDIVETPL
jgi:hypothetical protein